MIDYRANAKNYAQDKAVNWLDNQISQHNVYDLIEEAYIQGALCAVNHGVKEKDFLLDHIKALKTLLEASLRNLKEKGGEHG